jgi:hypothetical protein
MQQLWELSSGGDNRFRAYVFPTPDELRAGVFEVDGRAKHWPSPPRITPFIDKKRKKQLPLPDIGWLLPGTIILNPTAYAALKDILLRFGEFLPLACDDQVCYFYNVTTLVDCIDEAASVSIGGCITQAVFAQAAVPNGVQIFKDPHTVRTSIYLTEAARGMLEAVIAEKNLTGLRFFAAGAE